MVCLDHALLHEKRYDSHKKSGTEGQAHTVAFSPDTDEQAAHQRPQSHWNAADQRMHAHSHGALILGKYFVDQAHGGRQGNS